MSIVVSVIAIIICAGVGALGAWQLVSWLGVAGVTGALLMAVIAMFAATLLFAAVIVVGRALRILH